MDQAKLDKYIRYVFRISGQSDKQVKRKDNQRRRLVAYVQSQIRRHN